MSGSRLILSIAIGAIAVVAVVWFITSFFVLKDENTRGALSGPAYALAADPATGRAARTRRGTGVIMRRSRRRLDHLRVGTIVGRMLKNTQALS